MNENNKTEEPGFIASIVKDDGVQRAAAGVVVAIIVAGVKKALFAAA
jgi:hypothetical protein